MTKKLLKLIAFASVLFLVQCRSEDYVVTQETKNAKKFVAFDASSDGEIKYAKIFQNLLIEYKKLHPADFPQNTNKNSDSIYIDFAYSSQTIEYGDSLKVVVFPLRRGNQVIDAVLARTKNHNTVGFIYLTDDEKYNNIKLAFQNALDNSLVLSGKGGIKTVEIEEVVIPSPYNPNAPMPVGGPELSYPPLPPDGTCDSYNNCEPLTENGGGSPANAGAPNPCAKVKNASKTANKKLLDSLKGKVSDTIEHGYLIKDNITGNGVSSTKVQGSNIRGQMNITISGKIDSFIHSHFTGLLSIFSPADLLSLAAMYKNNNINNLNTFIVGVVTASGTQYMMVIDDPQKFIQYANSTLPGNNVTQNDLNIADYSYEKLNKINSGNSVAVNEQRFVKYISSNGSGLKLLKGNSDFTEWEQLNQNADGTVTKVKCK